MNKINQTKKTEHTKNVTKAFFVRYMMILALLLGVAGTVMGQSYVIYYGSDFLGSNTTTATADFVPNASIYTQSGTSFQNANGYYLRPRDGNGTLRFSTTERTGWSISNGNMLCNTYYYIIYSGGTFSINYNGNRATVSQVTSTEVLKKVTDFSITSGNDIISSIGTFPYTHDNAIYTPAYTKYEFGSFEYYGTNPAQAASTTAPAATEVTTGYTWSLNANGANASVNSSNGTITVNALPTTDITMTLTCSVTSNGITKTANKAIVLQGTTVAAPTITRSLNDITLATASVGATIYYTTDGTNPSSSSTAYSGPFSIEALDYPVTVKAIAIRNGTNSTIASETYNNPKVATPVISISSTGAVTITCATEGATIRYTTGSTTPADPTSSTGTAGTSTTLTNLYYIKARAFKAGYDDSEVASDQYITSGVSGTKVIIDDREDHNWSYYQASGDLPTGYPTTYLSSPDPRNVKITYRGINATDSKPHLSNGNAINNATAVAISALDGEGQNEMIYYKTLEKSVPGMSGDYPYTVISNPFSKRPSTGSGNSKVYYGFAGWKVVDGGEYISEYSDGQTLPLDATIHFTALDAGYTPNCTSAEVVFEATWTSATVKTGTSAQSFTGGTYETNFWVLTGNATAAVTVPANSTMSARYPDGTVSTNTNFTRAITAGGNNAKVEFVNMNSTQNVNAAGYTFTMGRGIVNSGNGGTLYGVNSDKACTNTVKIESGKFTNLYNFGAGISAGNTVNQLMILGCDYDRAKNDNSKLSITTLMYVGTGIQLNRTSGTLYLRTYIKSGQFLYGKNVSDASADYCYYYSVANTYNLGRRFLQVEGGLLNSIAGGIDGSNTESDLAFCFRMKGGTLKGSIYGAAAFAETHGLRQMIFTGGEVQGWIAGGCNGVNTDQTLNANSGVLPTNTYLYIGGTTKVKSTSNTDINSSPGGNVFGAGVGRQALVNAGNNGGNTGRVNTSYVAVSDESEVEHNVFAGGNFGFNNVGGNVFITGGTVHGSVFGGANQNKGGYSSITMTGGLVEGGIYGGSNSTGTLSGNATLQIDGGQVGTLSTPANIHGGGYGQPTVISGNVTLNLGTCNASSGVTVYGDVYGGSALGTVNTDANNTTTVSLYKGTIYGGLYGGALGQTTPSSIAAAVNGKVAVKVFGGSVLCTTSDPDGEAGTGSVFGCNNINGTPASTVTVDIYKTDQPLSGYALHAVYGGGNKSAYSGTPVVTIHGCNNSIEYVYGGGNAANVAGTNVTIWGGNIGNAFAGGNGFSAANPPNHNNPSGAHYNPGANITTNGTQLKIYGGTIGAAFGGSNQFGTINSTISVTVEAGTEVGSDPCGNAYGSCAMDIAELYGGGNEATIQMSNNNWITPSVTIGCNANIGMLFGGAKAADYVGDIVLNVDGGTFNKVFGGNNKGGTITGNVTVNFKGGTAKEVYGGCNESGDIKGIVTVNIDENSSRCGVFYVENVYGGGNLAGYNPETARVGADRLIPLVNIKNGTVQENVYGGGYGSTATITGNPVVTVGDSDNAKRASVKGSVFGGGNAAAIDGDTLVKILYKSRVYGNVYGGGNQGEVDGDTKVIVNGD